MKKHTRILSLALATAITAGSLLSACTPAASGSSAVSSQAGAQSSEASKPEAADVSVMMPHFGGIPTDKPVHQQWEKLMNEKLGTTINFTWNYVPYAEYKEKMNVALASNDLPDLYCVMDKTDTTAYEDQEMFYPISEHKDLIPNYLRLVGEATYGMEKIENGEGNFFGFQNIGIPRLKQGLGIYTVPTYRYDIFEKEKIKIPETTEEFYQAAKKLKELYPNSYPVGRNWATSEEKIFHTSSDFFWDGKAFQYGPVTENFKDMLVYLNKLYADGLLDPESFTDKDDAHNKKALNGTNMMQLGEWFTTALNWNLNKDVSVKWINALAPDDAKYGQAWQDVSNVNEVSVGTEMLMINAKTKYPELLMQLCDLQYTDEVIELITWGIEGESFTKKEDGTPTFIDQIKKAENPWKEADNFGMRASASYRPGLIRCDDTRAYIDFAPNDPCYIDGKIVEEPWEKAFPNESWPDSTMIPTNVFAPPVSFTPDENQDKSNTMTAVKTYVDESKLKFIKGELSFDKWDEYVKQIENMGYKTFLDMYNAKAAELVKE